MGAFRDKRIVLGELSCQLGTARLRDGEYLDTLDGSLAAGCIIRAAQLRIILRTAVGMETLRPALPIDEGAVGDIVFLGDISLKPDLDAGNAVANATLVLPSVVYSKQQEPPLSLIEFSKKLAFRKSLSVRQNFGLFQSARGRKAPFVFYSTIRTFL